MPNVKPLEQPFDPKRVENLKESLLDSLKNAANVRGLKEDDYVTVVVRSGEGGPDTLVRRFMIDGNGPGGVATGGPEEGEPFKQPSRSKSTLTMRVKKADIDAFAKGKLDTDGFRKKVSTALY